MIINCLSVIFNIPDKSSGMEGVPMVLEEYLSQAEINLKLMSRTAKGFVDTSSSPDKADKMTKGLTGTVAANLALTNYLAAIRYAFNSGRSVTDSPKILRLFVEKLATEINTGILKNGILIRSGADSSKYPYTRITDLESAMTEFYQELYGRIHDSTIDLIETAAWIEWQIDFRDHFFADGCGKTAKAVSTWLLMTIGHKLPDYTAGSLIPQEKARDVYYGHSPSYIRGTDHVREIIDFKLFLNYYRGLF